MLVYPKIFGLFGRLLLVLAKLFYLNRRAKHQRNCPHSEGFQIEYELTGIAINPRRYFATCPQCKKEFTDSRRDNLETQVFNCLYQKRPNPARQSSGGFPAGFPEGFRHGK